MNIEALFNQEDEDSDKMAGDGDKNSDVSDEGAFSRAISTTVEDWTEIDKDGWENMLGSGRLRRKIVIPAEVQNVKPTRGDYVKVSIKGTIDNLHKKK
jgi:hypothetical protein